MTPNQYQTQASRTLIEDMGKFAPDQLNLTIDTIGTFITISTAIEHIKKGIFHRHGFNKLQHAKIMIQAIMTINKNGSISRLTTFTNHQIGLLWNITGLIGEVGELTAYLFLHLWQGDKLDPIHVEKELGDILWYIAAIATKLNLNLETIMQTNITKLQSRYPHGFTTTDSITRADVGQGE